MLDIRKARGGSSSSIELIVKRMMDSFFEERLLSL
jgi:hypothetical protein